MANAVHLAIMRILQPLARLLVSQGVSYGQVSEMLKTAMVRAAFERAKHGPTQQGTTDSTVSVATGIHRKDIKRLREQAPSDPEPLEGTTASQVLAQWLALGTPPPLLMRRKDKAGSSSFDELVEGISTDTRPRSVLEALLARQVVTEREDGLLEVHAERLVLNQDTTEIVNYLGMNVHDHLSVAVSNLTQGSPPMLERCVHFHGISKALAEELHALAQEQAMAGLMAINTTAQSRIKDAKNKGPYRINFGVYFHKGDDREI